MLEARIHLILGAFLPLDISWIHLAWKSTAWIDHVHLVCFVWPSFCKITLGHKANLLLKRFLKQAYEANTFKYSPQLEIGLNVFFCYGILSKECYVEDRSLSFSLYSSSSSFFIPWTFQILKSYKTASSLRVLNGTLFII